jgi:hypothetical protein
MEPGNFGMSEENMDQETVERMDQGIPREARQLVADLRGLQERVSALRRRRPEIPDEMLEQAEPYSAAAELAVALEGVALDLGPLIQRLEEATAVTPERLRADWERGRQDGPAEGPQVDLRRFSEGARRTIYEDVVRSRFQPGSSAFTPDDLELQVLYLLGRWLVVYRKLSEIQTPGLPSPQELLVVGTNERSEPVYLAV